MRLLPIVTVAVLMIPSSLHAADTPKEIIEAGIKAIGGKEVLLKYPASTWTEKGDYYGMGSAVPFTGKYAVQFPDRFRMEIVDFFISSIDGESGWMSQGGQVIEIEGDALKAQIDAQKCGWVASLRPFVKDDHGFELEALGESTIMDTEVVGVRAKKEGYRDVDLFFAKDTHLLKSVSYQTIAQESNELVDNQSFYSDYTDVQGMKVPLTLLLHRGGEKFLDVVHSEMVLAEKLDDSIFAKPK